MASLRRFRFRPRFLALAWGACAVGIAVAAAGLVFGASGFSQKFALACGAVGVLLALLYLASPAWRIAVQVDDNGFEVLCSGQRRFHLSWAEVQKVIAARDSQTCFVDGGSPARSLLLPGPGASAPYRIEQRDQLFEHIIAHVPPDRVVEVARLDKYSPGAMDASS
jgi:hypothetical protein